MAGRSKAGLTDKEIADEVGVTVQTIRRWKKAHPEFCKALIETKATLDSRVELTLYRRALGYSYKEVEVTLEPGPGDTQVETKRVERTKEVLPDISAIRLWLINRDAANWRDKQDVEHSGAVDVGVRNMSDEELKRAIRDAAATLGPVTD
jgi:transcriptional regulator with XRE-family HTH domain